MSIEKTNYKCKTDKNENTCNSKLNVIEELQLLKKEILLKEKKFLDKPLKRLYHLLKVVDPKDYNIQSFCDDINFMKELKTICGRFQKPIELLAARTLGHVTRIVCFYIGSLSDEVSVDAENLPESTKRLIKSIPCFCEVNKSFTIEDELDHLGECEDEDICLYTIAIFRSMTINCGCTPLIGCEKPDKIGKWLHGLLSNGIHSVILDALDLLRIYFSYNIILDCGEDANTNSLLAIDSFAPAPNLLGIPQQSQSPHSSSSSGWVPPVYSKGPVCSIALSAFQCLCSITREQHRAFVQLLTSEEIIVEKVKSYLFGSWAEESWKAIFRGSKFNDDDERVNIYSTSGANFQQMVDGLFCEEKSVQEMMMSFRETAVKCFGRWLSVPISQSIQKFFKRDLLSQIAFLLCEATSDTLRDEAAKALLNAWAILSSNAHIVPHLKRIYKYDLKRYACLSQQSRGRLSAMLADACEEEGVMDVLLGHIARNEYDERREVKKEEQIKARMKAKCDLKICPVCAMYAEANTNREEEEEEEAFGMNRSSDVNKDPDDFQLWKRNVEVYLKPLAECLDASRMSSNEYTKMLFESDDFFYFWGEETDCSQESDMECATTNGGMQLPIPSAEVVNSSLKLGSTNAGVEVLAHVSDLHIGNTGYITEDAGVLFSFIKEVVNPLRIYSTGDLTHAETPGNYFKKTQREDEWELYSKYMHNAGFDGCLTYVEVRGNHDEYGVGEAGAEADHFSRRAVCREKYENGVWLRKEAVQGISGVQSYYFLLVDATSRPGPFPPYATGGDLLGQFEKDTASRTSSIDSTLKEEMEYLRQNEGGKGRANTHMLFLLTHFPLTSHSIRAQLYLQRLAADLSPESGLGLGSGRAGKPNEMVLHSLVFGHLHLQNLTLPQFGKEVSEADVAVKRGSFADGGEGNDDAASSNKDGRRKNKTKSRTYFQIGAASWRDQGCFNVMVVDNGAVGWEEICVPMSSSKRTIWTSAKEKKEKKEKEKEKEKKMASDRNNSCALIENTKSGEKGGVYVTPSGKDPSKGKVLLEHSKKSWVVVTNPQSAAQTSSRFEWWRAAISTHIRAAVLMAEEGKNVRVKAKVDVEETLDAMEKAERRRGMKKWSSGEKEERRKRLKNVFGEKGKEEAGGKVVAVEMTQSGQTKRWENERLTMLENRRMERQRKMRKAKEVAKEQNEQCINKVNEFERGNVEEEEKEQHYLNEMDALSEEEEEHLRRMKEEGEKASPLWTAEWKTESFSRSGTKELSQFYGICPLRVEVCWTSDDGNERCEEKLHRFSLGGETAQPQVTMGVLKANLPLQRFMLYFVATGLSVILFAVLFGWVGFRGCGMALWWAMKGAEEKGKVSECVEEDNGLLEDGSRQKAGYSSFSSSSSSSSSSTSSLSYQQMPGELNGDETNGKAAADEETRAIDGLWNSIFYSSTASSSGYSQSERRGKEGKGGRKTGNQWKMAVKTVMLRRDVVVAGAIERMKNEGKGRREGKQAEMRNVDGRFVVQGEGSSYAFYEESGSGGQNVVEQTSAIPLSTLPSDFSSNPNSASAAVDVGIHEPIDSLNKPAHLTSNSSNEQRISGGAGGLWQRMKDSVNCHLGRKTYKTTLPALDNIKQRKKKVGFLRRIFIAILRFFVVDMYSAYRMSMASRIYIAACIILHFCVPFVVGQFVYGRVDFGFALFAVVKGKLIMGNEFSQLMLILTMIVWLMPMVLTFENAPFEIRMQWKWLVCGCLWMKNDENNKLKKKKKKKKTRNEKKFRWHPKRMIHLLRQMAARRQTPQKQAEYLSNESLSGELPMASDTAVGMTPAVLVVMTCVYLFSCASWVVISLLFGINCCSFPLTAGCSIAGALLYLSSLDKALIEEEEKEEEEEEEEGGEREE
ncbi:uncharacterized protein MONOS_4690 [Monocercomonoides exilis]|uniref:uncharacterized protein n=1 Tax=Monocercomonoides exilis TaxID=2049356 RepID=UPI00355A4813|nr:hypothetical protein MONOS_4690 [Monocercomonoides exilis]|eukprot:MONOS_4690.1-p1 / transcript=MONOS_4690.1 / gene=MONOS_4690 / organism=Monocercomonoides_exilis_PA203 / gene_product=unspecified product / transcript_product=unspecified product / location=Mono_scaffold00127:83111-91016(+) / protein_length=1878 / sequence_SO=supercontig / SO=protein_coding / is_pseudo=false